MSLKHVESITSQINKSKRESYTYWFFSHLNLFVETNNGARIIESVFELGGS